MICPCCGQEADRVDPVKLGRYLGFTGNAARVYEFLAAHFGQTMLPARIHHAMYWDDSDGGPMNPGNVLSVVACRMRPVLKPFGLTIQGFPHAGGYVLRWIDSEMRFVERDEKAAA